ncbi:type II toxin-antitoxin system CcdA family antitoxin [Frigidibacter oleivorans]|uniref:type II toxin-antitoxin system CcdA family antitoxin n=1 Tax=Frigidibacter oleivorans TaxID=2487129 RepID=UPI000F8CCCB9|nr:type II toxin-antitoxin system CcdA family antitoxin [Frigidibacter oleivorans]
MTAPARRTTSLSLDAEAVDSARALGLDVSAVAEAALLRAVARARQDAWRHEHADIFAAQARWHDEHAHPLRDILADPDLAGWTR